MVPKSRFFQENFSATLLRSVALAIALIVTASPARAEVVTLVCQNQLEGGGSFTLQVDYDRMIVNLLSSDGTIIVSAEAKISASDVKWYWDNSKWDYSSPKAQGFTGGLNRLSGEGGMTYYERQTVFHNMVGPCRRATQKF